MEGKEKNDTNIKNEGEKKYGVFLSLSSKESKDKHRRPPLHPKRSTSPVRKKSTSSKGKDKRMSEPPNLLRKSPKLVECVEKEKCISMDNLTLPPNFLKETQKYGTNGESRSMAKSGIKYTKEEVERFWKVFNEDGNVKLGIGRMSKSEHYCHEKYVERYKKKEISGADLVGVYNRYATSIRPGIFLSSYFIASSRLGLEGLKVKYIINMSIIAKACPNAYEGEVLCDNGVRYTPQYLSLLLYDNGRFPLWNYFMQVIKFIESKKISKRNALLIHCHMGVSRSTTVLVAYLMWKEKKMKTEVMENDIKMKRLSISPKVGFELQLLGWEELIRDDKNWLFVSLPFDGFKGVVLHVPFIVSKKVGIDLNTYTFYVMLAKKSKTIYVWEGEKAKEYPKYQELAGSAYQFAIDLSRYILTCNIVNVKEGEETENFLSEMKREKINFKSYNTIDQIKGFQIVDGTVSVKKKITKFLNKLFEDMDDKMTKKDTICESDDELVVMEKVLEDKEDLIEVYEEKGEGENDGEEEVDETSDTRSEGEEEGEFDDEYEGESDFEDEGEDEMIYVGLNDEEEEEKEIQKPIPKLIPKFNFNFLGGLKSKSVMGNVRYANNVNNANSNITNTNDTITKNTNTRI